MKLVKGYCESCERPIRVPELTEQNCKCARCGKCISLQSNQPKKKPTVAKLLLAAVMGAFAAGCGLGLFLLLTNWGLPHWAAAIPIFVMMGIAREIAKTMELW